MAIAPVKKENTIYVRPSNRTRIFGFEAFGKAKGEGFIVGGVTRDDAIRAAGQVLWCIEKFGPFVWKNMAPIDALPGIPDTFNYEVIDEK